MTAYVRTGLAAAVIAAIRSAVTDPALVQRVDDNESKIGAVRSRMDTIDAQLAELKTDDTGQMTIINGIREEMIELADALTGPSNDDDDNGVLAEVQLEGGAPMSLAANQIAEDAGVVQPDVVDGYPAADTVETSGFADADTATAEPDAAPVEGEPAATEEGEAEPAGDNVEGGIPGDEEEH